MLTIHWKVYKNFGWKGCLKDWAHNGTFTHEERRTQTSLSEHIWSIKDQELDYIINWKIIEKTSGFNPITLQCKICLSEIYHIIINPNQASLNKRHETYSYCRHLKKYTLDKAQFYYIKGGALILKSGRWVILSINFNFF